jgi:hypothetical protein
MKESPAKMLSTIFLRAGESSKAASEAWSNVPDHTSWLLSRELRNSAFVTVASREVVMSMFAFPFARKGRSTSCNAVA